MGGNQHRVPCRKALDELTHGADLVRIQSNRRFIQDDQFRLMDQSVGQSHPLAVALGELADDFAAHFGQLALLHDRVDP